jgi:hypothetical protein
MAPRGLCFSNLVALQACVPGQRLWWRSGLIDVADSNKKTSRGIASMYARNRKLFLSVTTFVEAATGLCLLILPGVLLTVLLGLNQATVDVIFVGRLTGAALLAIGIASWIARTDTRTPSQVGLLIGILIYNLAATVLLAFAGSILAMMGILLWPAVVLHAILAVWCFRCLQPERHGVRLGVG